MLEMCQSAIGEFPKTLVCMGSNHTVIKPGKPLNHCIHVLTWFPGSPEQNPEIRMITLPSGRIVTTLEEVGGIFLWSILNGVRDLSKVKEYLESPDMQLKLHLLSTSYVENKKTFNTTGDTELRGLSKHLLFLEKSGQITYFDRVDATIAEYEKFSPILLGFNFEERIPEQIEKLRDTILKEVEAKDDLHPHPDEILYYLQEVVEREQKGLFHDLVTKILFALGVEITEKGSNAEFIRELRRCLGKINEEKTPEPKGKK